MVGAVRLEQLCGELEAMGRSGCLAGAEATAAAIEQEFDHVRIALKTPPLGG